MPLQPVGVGFLVQGTEMLVRADLLGVLRANGQIAGSALVVLHLPVTEEIGSSAAGAELWLRMTDTANDSITSVRHLEFEAHCGSPIFLLLMPCHFQFNLRNPIGQFTAKSFQFANQLRIAIFACSVSIHEGAEYGVPDFQASTFPGSACIMFAPLTWRWK